MLQAKSGLAGQGARCAGYIGIIAVLFVAGACSGDFRKSHVTHSPIEVHENLYKDRMKTADIDDETLRVLSRHYKQNGDGPMTLRVSYNPASDINTAVKASRQGARIAEKLRGYGVDEVDVDILPVKESGKDSHTLVHYKHYRAQGPKGCRTMPGVASRPATTSRIEKRYQFGCTLDTLLARQVERPADLLGSAPREDDNASGRRAGNIINKYRSGEPNESLDTDATSGGN